MLFCGTNMALALDRPLPPTVAKTAPRANQPHGMLLPLKDHQLAILHKCSEIEKTAVMSPYKMGFMADEVAAGKCHGKGTRVLMFSGELKNVEDIEVGDQLMGDDSTPRNVLALGRGTDKMYNIIPTDKHGSYTANSAHLVCLADGSVRSAADCYADNKHLLGYRAQVEFSRREIKQCPFEYGLTLDRTDRVGDIWKFNDRVVREAVLLGLLENFGVPGGIYKRHCVVICRSEGLQADILFLAHSLGLKASKEEWAVSISPFEKDLSYPFYVEEVGEGEYYGFHLDGNHRYVLADLSVTHNTVCSLGMIMAEKGVYRRTFLNIIVVPQNICLQWRDEITKFTGKSLRTLVLIDYSSLSELTFEPSALCGYDVVLTTPAYFATLADFCEQYKITPRRVIIDEADTIANMVNRKIPGTMTWFVSATMDRLPESKAGMVQVGKETKQIEEFETTNESKYLSTVKGGQLRTEEVGTYEIPARLLRSGERVCRCEAAWVKESFKIPDPIKHRIICPNIILDVLAALTYSKLLLPKQLESANARDFRNLKIGTDDEFDILPSLVKWYVDRKQDASASLDSLKGAMHMEGRIKECEDECRRCSAYLRLIRDRAADALLCQGTFEQLAQPDRTQGTVDRCWMCPHCGAGYSIPWVQQNPGTACLRCGKEKVELEERSCGEPAKWDNKVKRLAEIIEGLRSQQPRVMVFAKYTQAFSALKEELKGSGLVVKEADAGTAQAAEKMLEEFKSGKTDVLLAESSLFCSGMNLPEVTDVCFLHMVHAYSDKQIAGRAQRPGRKEPARIWTFLHPNEAV